MLKKKNTLIRETLQARLKPARVGDWLGKDAPAPGPFEPQAAEPGVGNDVVRALATGMLVMYPVAAIVVVVVATSLLLGLGTPA